MLQNIGKSLFKFGIKKIKSTSLKEALKFSNQDIENIMNDATGIYPLNDGEDERLEKAKKENHQNTYIKKWEKEKQAPMLRDVSTWSKQDLSEVMQSPEYTYDKNTQVKVQKYFEHKYPGNQKYDETGKSIK